ncbi:MAG: FHA domain-containing protein [Solirubrobacterales bacterium]|nr:FHA domain-containing protein [Solirubrobacterales bacterium]
MDSARSGRENQPVIRPGESRRQIARTLNTAYANGLLSQDTFTIRIEHLLRRRLIDPRWLIGDLSFRAQSGWRATLAELQGVWAAWRADRGGEREVLLALDWSGEPGELLIGRHHGCDVVLGDPSVSRRHARVVFRDGGWVLQDLASTNGTTVNGSPVGRCQLRPGDHLRLGSKRLRVD